MANSGPHWASRPTPLLPHLTTAHHHISTLPSGHILGGSRFYIHLGGPGALRVCGKETRTFEEGHRVLEKSFLQNSCCGQARPWVRDLQASDTVGGPLGSVRGDRMNFCVCCTEWCVCVCYICPVWGGLGTGRDGPAAVPSPGRALPATPVPATGATPGP